MTWVSISKASLEGIALSRASNEHRQFNLGSNPTRQVVAIREGVLSPSVMDRKERTDLHVKPLILQI